MRTRLRIHTLLRRYLQRYGEPPREHVADSVDRIWQTLEPHGHTASGIAPSAFPVASAFRRKSHLAFAAAAVLVIAVGTAIVWRPADDALFRVADGEAHASGDTIQSNGGGAGAVLALADGSRVEMRSQSELSLARADDGLLIRLVRGGIIVDAATQRAGHLYVQTRDVRVSVVGTIFLVNAEQHGSRVAVIEGEVRVQQGANEKKLLPGEQVASSPSMPPASIRDEIAWARNAPVLVGLLEQAARTLEASAPQNAAPPLLTFEAVSIRPSVPGIGGRGGGLPNYLPGGACSGFPELDPRRFAVKNVTVVTLIARAYGTPGRSCTHYQYGLVTGGPGWITTDQFDVQAAIPAGAPSYTVRQYENNDAPGLQRMLQAMLVDRFQLGVRREMREMPVEVLTLGRSRDTAQLMDAAAESIRRESRPEVKAHFAAIADGTSNTAGGTVSTEGNGLWGVRASMTEIASYLTRVTGRPVIDRTGLAVDLTFWVPFDRPTDGLGGFQGYSRPLSATSLALFRKALGEQLGLELAPGTAPVEVLVIERVERPSEN
jgi:uncharacterized protein (TIGR03435 family)